MSEQLLSLSNVSFCYSDKVMLIQNLSLDIAKGERVFVMGASGSGKTTLLNLIGGVLLPGSGEITVLGQSLSSMKASKRDTFRADSIGIIFQQFNLIPYLSVIENVMLPLQFSVQRRKRIQGAPEKEARILLKKLGLEDSTLLGGPCSRLSVGQRQRVAAARALLGKPEIIIADEPTSALDPKRSNEFLDILFKQCDESGSTLIFVSHEESLQDKFSRVISLEDFS